MTAGRPRCSSLSLALAESQRATASVVSRWIMLERPGPWGYEALEQSRLPLPVAAELRRRGRALGIRVVLIRRPGRFSGEGSECFFSYTGVEVRRLQRAHLEGPADLLDLDWSPLLRGQAVGVGQDQEEPLFLVCTNGARDPCCAERGRSVAATLAARFGDRAWECSHIGGDRFAANIVCFPHGIYFGRVAPSQAVAVATDYREGRLHLELYRGRSCYDFATQAAEWFVREARNLAGVDEVRLLHTSPGPGRQEADFAVPGGSVRVVVAIRPSARARRLTCHGTRESHPPTYELLELLNRR